MPHAPPGVDHDKLRQEILQLVQQHGGCKAG